jgi:hypothetical protein
VDLSGSAAGTSTASILDQFGTSLSDTLGLDPNSPDTTALVIGLLGIGVLSVLVTGN